MIYKKFGNCLFANQALTKQVALYNSDTFVTEEPHFEEYTNLAHNIIRDYAGFIAKVETVLKNIFVTVDNPLTGDKDTIRINQFLELIQDMVSDNEELYIKPFHHPYSATQVITQADIDNKTAFLVSLESDIDIENFNDVLTESGQYYTMRFRSLQLVEPPVITVGYGAGGYGDGGYGHQE